MRLREHDLPAAQEVLRVRGVSQERRQFAGVLERRWEIEALYLMRTMGSNNAKFYKKFRLVVC
jgi:hypothetical protein